MLQAFDLPVAEKDTQPAAAVVAVEHRIPPGPDLLQALRQAVHSGQLP